MRIVRLLAISSITILIGCQKRLEPIAPGTLRQLVDAIKTLPPCNTRIPMEWPVSWPIPLSNERGYEFKVFFFPLGRTSSGVQLKEPLGEATLNIKSAKVMTCESRTDHPKILSSRRWPASVSNLSMDQFDSNADALFNATQEAALVYAAKDHLTSENRSAIKKFNSLFKSMAEPDLLNYYYQLNPDFWNWLRTESGDSISSASPGQK